MINSKLSLLFGCFAAIIFAIGAQDTDFFDIGGGFKWKIDVTNLTSGSISSHALELNNLTWHLTYIQAEPKMGRLYLEAIPNNNIPYWTCQVEASVNSPWEISIENATFSNEVLKKHFSGDLVFAEKKDKKFILDFNLSMTPLDTRAPPSISDSDSDINIVQTSAKQLIKLNITDFGRMDAIIVPVKNKVQGVKWNIHFELENGHLFGFLKPNETNLKPNSVYEVNGIFKIISFNESKPIIEKFKGQLTNDSIDKSIRAPYGSSFSIIRGHGEFIKNENMNIVVEFKVNKSIDMKTAFNQNWQILEDNSKYYST